MTRATKKLFTTEQVVELLGLKSKDKWRVIKFAESKEYGIEPAVVMGEGLGSRRFYDMENVCQIAVALALLEGFATCGHRRSHSSTWARHHLAVQKTETRWTPICMMVLEQQFGSLLSKSRFLSVDFTDRGYTPESILDHYEDTLLSGSEYAVLFIPIDSMFRGIRKRSSALKEVRNDNL